MTAKIQYAFLQYCLYTDMPFYTTAFLHYCQNTVQPLVFSILVLTLFATKGKNRSNYWISFAKFYYIYQFSGVNFQLMELKIHNVEINVSSFLVPIVNNIFLFLDLNFHLSAESHISTSINWI